MSAAKRSSVSIPRYGVDEHGNEVLLVRHLGAERPDGADCESCCERIHPDQAAYRDQFRSVRGNWYTHASPGECIDITEVGPEDGWTRIPLGASG